MWIGGRVCEIFINIAVVLWLFSYSAFGINVDMCVDASGKLQ